MNCLSFLFLLLTKDFRALFLASSIALSYPSSISLKSSKEEDSKILIWLNSSTKSLCYGVSSPIVPLTRARIRFTNLTKSSSLTIRSSDFSSNLWILGYLYRWINCYQKPLTSIFWSKFMSLIMFQSKFVFLGSSLFPYFSKKSAFLYSSVYLYWFWVPLDWVEGTTLISNMDNNE